MDATDTAAPETRYCGRSQALLYNTIRPHASLGYKPPAPEVFVPAFAAWPAALRPTGSVGHAGATANLKLTFHLDHSVGADQRDEPGGVATAPDYRRSRRRLPGDRLILEDQAEQEMHVAAVRSAFRRLGSIGSPHLAQIPYVPSDIRFRAASMCFSIFKFNGLLPRNQLAAVSAIRGRPSRAASAVLKGALL